jgi:hypothetical protein
VAASDLRSLATALLAVLALICPSLALADSPSPAPTPLSAGQLGSYSWSVKASSLIGTKPCLSVAVTHRHGLFNYDRSRFHECAVASSGRTRSTPPPPLLVGGIHLGGDGSSMTVYGVLASAGTRKVRVTLSDGPEEARVSTRLRPLAVKADRARTLSFAVIVLAGRHCVERLAAVGAGGTVLWQGTPTDHACA